MSKKEIEIYVDKNNRVSFHDFIEMKIKYDTEYQKKDKEIERLNKQIEEYQKALDETTSEKIDLENIIKEARERIITPSKFIERTERLKLLEILDKGKE